MKITIINGSPKLGESTSGLLINHLVSMLDSQEIRLVNINRGEFTEEDEAYLQQSDALLIAFPLYIDSIPSHLLKFMVYLELRNLPNTLRVYCVINNGFFEGKQNRFAIQQMKLWCKKANLTWGQALGVGAGEMIPVVKDIPLGYGPNTALGKNLTRLADNIIAGRSDDDSLINLDWSRLLWRFQAAKLVWLPRAKKNGLTKKQMYRKLNNE